MEISLSDYLAHYGTPRHSGRYPWGSGGDEETTQRNRDFLGMVDKMKKEGMSETEIATGLGMTTKELRNAKSIAKNQQKAANIAEAQRLKAKGLSNIAIGEKMGLNESSVRDLLVPGQKDKNLVLNSTADMLKDKVAEKGFIDVGTGVEAHLAISRTKLDTALAKLQQEGYEVHKVQVDQLGTNNKTTVKVLAPPGTTYRDIVSAKEKIQPIGDYSDDGGRSWTGIQPPLSVSSKRVAVRYAEDGGADSDGVIYIRPGVKDVSLDGARYAQVRISVNGTHYLKGMAMYKDDLPPGVDLMFNTNKHDTGNKLDAMKKLKRNAEGDVDEENPFGAVVRQITVPQADGSKKVTSAMNIVNEEGKWDEWSRNLSSQALAKQSPLLAKSQLNMTYERKRAELDQIMALNNPSVKKKLLEGFADSTDSSSVHLKAAALPRQRTQVLLPMNSMKETEIYAPNFNNGERVALIRFPHGGIFEIPELTVNNRNPQARKMMGDAKDAIGINSKVASRLSGADFDGDTVLVIPNDKGHIKTAPSLKGLVGFDPQARYPGYEGMKTIDGGTYHAATKTVEFAEGKKSSPRGKGTQMGLVSNLITDMTLQGANSDELARAVRHSMVVIDSEKHVLNYKQSAIDNGISQLMEKYQGRKQGGAATLISRARSREDVLARKARSAAEGGAIDKVTGKKVFVNTGESWVDASGKTVFRTQKSVKLAETDDAHTLSSGTPIEKVYADHSNKLKAMANEARLAAVHVKTAAYSPSAKAAYSKEVTSLNAKLDLALRNAPLERHAQLLANAAITQKMQANPDMEASELKKLKSLALTEYRNRTGASKQRIEITSSEWAAIQAGAISPSKLDQILVHADLETVKELATPRTSNTITTVQKQRAEAMSANGYTQAEIAQSLGVPLNTLKSGLSEKGS